MNLTKTTIKTLHRMASLHTIMKAWEQEDDMVYPQEVADGLCDLQETMRREFDPLVRMLVNSGCLTPENLPTPEYRDIADVYNWQDGVAGISLRKSAAAGVQPDSVEVG